MMTVVKEKVGASSPIRLTCPKEDPERTGDVTGVERLSLDLLMEIKRRKYSDSVKKIS
jgi:hypothetical protein